MDWDYLVCPKCGNPMYRVNGLWVCRVCGFAIPERKTFSIDKKRVSVVKRKLLTTG